MYRRGVSKKDQKAVNSKKTNDSVGKFAELLVFGYECKVFRDDERALYHEQGKHLIPWMGDKSIMIDRYDGRGHLHDLSEYDAESWNRDYHLSEEEARIEALCDEERYLALHTDLLEEEARQEEEYKRLSEALADEGTYNAVGFQYSADYYDPSQPTEEEELAKEAAEQEPEESEEPFIAPPGLCVAPDVELPATTKMHAIIERTASFVSKQGAQFEIMLKAKQSRNSQFDFLRFDHYLNPYYKHILKAMKEGRYTSQTETKPDENQNSGTDDTDDDEDGCYLHPSLFASKKCNRLEELMKPLQVMDPDHPLAALVRKAQQDNDAATKKAEESLAAAAAAVAASTTAQAEYPTDPTVAAMYYGYYTLPDGTYCLAPPPPGIDVNTYYNSLPAGILPTSSRVVAPPPPGTTPPPPPAAVEASSRTVSTQAATVPTSSQAPVAAIIPPPPDTQPVIDKLAEYVARNGLKFETSVRAKNDARFEFLQSWNQYNAYYEFKKQYFRLKEGGNMIESLTASDSGNEAAVSPRESSVLSISDTESLITKAANCSSDMPSNEGKLIKASFAPISFAIKAKENDLLPLEKNRVKLDDDSDEEEGEKDGQDNPSSGVAKEAPVIEDKKPQLTPEELEAKQAKQKLEDRLSAAAREKLAQASKESKEKQLQAERKRKAALFLQNLRNPLTEPEVMKAEDSPAWAEEIFEVSAATSVGSKVLAEVESKSSNKKSCKRKDSLRDREKEKKKKKHKKRSRSRSQSRSRCSSRSHSRSKTKHALPSAYRTVRKSRSRSRSPNRRRARSSERRREEKEREKCVPSAYRISNSPGFSKKRSRSRYITRKSEQEKLMSPHEKKKKRSSKSQIKSKAQSRSQSSSPKQASNKKPVSAHSTSISPVESRDSSQERSRGESQEKDKPVSSPFVSSLQTKITQDMMAKVRAMLAASKDLQASSS
ncbi:splicing factor, suppressor of white-apricot homolog isoform X3 [Polyodon spathula]|uniref:splicing factor, suppressor of white-apricot homolog isoform X3 n=1 Tax=Polyodon spathula TaxID=7913 RepID=UPI001B7DF27C|nr:splicing factor, suppressor of white-apricot homolog isoform X3 [Polyodon spathula]